MFLQQWRFHQRTVRSVSGVEVEPQQYLCNLLHICRFPDSGYGPDLWLIKVHCLHRGGEAEQSLIIVVINPGAAAVTMFVLVVDITHWSLQLIPSEDQAEQEPLQAEDQRTEPEPQWVLTVHSWQTLLAVQQLNI